MVDFGNTEFAKRNEKWKRAREGKNNVLIIIALTTSLTQATASRWENS